MGAYIATGARTCTSERAPSRTAHVDAGRRDDGGLMFFPGHPHSREIAQQPARRMRMGGQIPGHGPGLSARLPRVINVRLLGRPGARRGWERDERESRAGLGVIFAVIRIDLLGSGHGALIFGGSRVHP